MKNPLLLALVALLCSFSLIAQPSNDNCPPTTAVAVAASGATCGATTTGNLWQSTPTTVTWTGGLGSLRDVWYKVSVPAGITSISVRVSLSATSQITPVTTFVELFNNTNCPAGGVSRGGYDITNVRGYSGLTAGTVYLLRVATNHPS